MATYESLKYAHTGAGLATNTIPATSVVDGTVSNTEFAYINTLSSNAQTQITSKLPKAGGTMTGTIVFPDDTGPAPAAIQMGAGTDIKILSEGTNGLIRVLNAFAVQNNGGTETLISAVPDGAVNLYFDNDAELTTTTNGIHIPEALGVGTTPSSTTGEIRATNEITAYYSSDSTLKENVKTIENALDKVNALRGVEFDWTDEHIKARGGEDGYFVRKRDTGLVAQNVKEVVPEVVAKRNDGTLGVKYEKLIGLLVQAINELSAKVKK